MAQQINPEDIAKAIQLLIQNAQNEGSQPFADKVQKTDKVTIPSKESENLKTLEPFTTGTFLDTMFLDKNEKPINGIPFGSNCILSGIPNVGKSLLLQDIVLKVANSGKKVIFTTSEEAWRTDTPRMDLENRFREKSKVLCLNWQTISENLFILDAVSDATLREWSTFINTLRSLVETEKIDLLVIDSLSMLEDSRGQIKFRLSELTKYSQLHGLTAILVNQRAIDEPDNPFNLAGGLALSHIADIVMELEEKKISSWDSTLKLDIPDAKQGQMVKFFRIAKCRICRYKANYFGYSINPNGIIELNQKT